MNTNAFHNLGNIAIVAIGALGGAALAAGCTATAAGFDCTMSWLPPQYVAFGLGALGALKLFANIWRDGLSGLFSPQPPVQK